MTFINFDQLSRIQLEQYCRCVSDAFPAVVHKSEVVAKGWKKVEEYFPAYQRILLDDDENVIAFVCTLPFHWNGLLSELPEGGWDWLMQKGVTDFENKTMPNCLGGLQIVISRSNQGKGLSQKLISEGKRIMRENGLTYFTLPIRPTFKHKFPLIPMSEYLEYKEDGKTYDPWIRSHLKSGARVLGICSNSMNVKADVAFWEKLKKQKITSSGMHVVEGALNPVEMDLDADVGEYREENIWIYYE